MEKKFEFTKHGLPLFDGHNYAFWSVRMKLFLQSQGVDVWNSILNEYKTPASIPTDIVSKKLYECNSKAMYVILGGLASSELVKVMHCKSTKEIWDKLKGIYEGDVKVKDAKLQIYRTQFESLKMDENETIAAYFLRVDEVVNTMRGLGEKIENLVVVRKVLRSLPMKFNAKVSVLEDRSDLATLQMDELHGILTTYEIRTPTKFPCRNEATFKASKKKDKKKVISKDIGHEDIGADEEEANFVRKLKRGTGKYKGKLPLKCFECGRIGHFASKCPFNRKSDGEEESNKKAKEYMNKHRKQPYKNSYKKMNLYSKENSSSLKNNIKVTIVQIIDFSWL